MKKTCDVEIFLEEEKYMPIYASDSAAGADLRARLPTPVIIPPGTSRLIPTGVRLALPQGYEVQIRPRSGLALKEGVTVLNAPGTIDADYRGEIGVILINHGDSDFLVLPEMRIAQMVLAPVVQARFTLRQTLSHTARGDGGFGHSGTL